MARPAKGTTVWQPETPKSPGHYRSRITLGDGSRPWIDHDPGPRSPVAEQSARNKAAAWTERARREGRTGKDFGLVTRAEREAQRAPTAPPAGETCDAWFARFNAQRADQGVGSAGDERYRWKGWVSPTLGPKPMATASKSDIEDVRDVLDKAMRRYRAEGRGEGRLAPKTAMNVWSVVTTAFKQATASKNRELRVREDNPCLGVLPPDTGDSRVKTFVFPGEATRLAACERVDLEWREVHAVACYAYLRPGELRALLWSDVDLAHGTLSITKAFDTRTRTVKAPKTRNGIRVVPIAPALLPLLQRMREGRGNADPVLPLLSRVNEDAWAGFMREHLALAGITRPRLTEDTLTTMPVNFRSWRDTGITWLALAGVDVVKMQRRAGHDTIGTTMGYVKAAEDHGGAIGEPFPALPECLVNGEVPSPESSRPGGVNLHPSVIVQQIECEGRELNPYRSYPAGT